MTNSNPTKFEKFKVNFFYACVQSFYWGAFCIYFSFVVTYLIENGFSNSQIGLAMTGISVLATITPSLVGYLADFRIPLKRIAIALMLLSIPAAFALQMTIAVIPLAFLSIFSMGITERSLMSLIDSWGTRIHQKRPYFNYGVTRGIASLFFAVTALIFGQVFAAIGLDSLFFIHAIFAGLTAFFMLFLDSIPIQEKPQKETAEKKESYFSVITTLLSDRKYLLLVISMTFFGIGLISIQTYLPVLMQSVGGDSGDLGMAWFVMGLSEFPIMLLFSKLSSRFKIYQLLRFAFFAMIIRVIINILVPSVNMLIAVQVLQGLSFGIFLPAALNYIGEIVDTRMKASAITFAMALNGGLAGIIGNMVGGFLADFLGVEYIFIAFSVFTVSAFLIFVYSTRGMKNQVQV